MLPATPQSPLSDSQPLNAVHEMVHRMFPDGPEQWTVSEILTAARSLYDDPQDIRWNKGKIHRAIVALRQRSTEFSLSNFQEFPSPSGYRYPPASCRLIVREVVNGRLPKKLR